MKERPILFSAPMVRAILEGRKTMTRRVVKPVPSDVWGHGVITDTRSTKFGKFCVHMRGEFCGDVHVECPYGTPGDRLWVRETFGYPEQNHENGIVYRATDSSWDDASTKNTKTIIWKPSIFMPRRESRITLDVTAVRVERLQEITEEDAIAEGVEIIPDAGVCYKDYTGRCVCKECAVYSFWSLWEKINGRESLDANPWVWVVGFKRV